ncbi:MAG: ADP-ribosylglycohydrolase family protein [Actinomycetota bacterium]|nr:ADP-ribosylglycohydrolase family protein [Actinomycetota bacterium]
MPTPSFPIAFPLDEAYAERVYAGVLGKVVGVYLGRPVEVGWDYESLTEAYVLVDDYVAERMGIPLVVTDDDITGTFTFLRGLRDHGLSLDVTAEQLGETWLNYLIDGRTILWWSGLGNSTEHTAYLRLKAGIPAPRSGSAALNTTLVAEQIGAQIFIDGWGMVVPGDPAMAASLARRAGSVSHDGEALHAAAVMAAMEAESFVDPRTDHLLDTALGLIPRDSLIASVIEDVREWSSSDGDWRETRARIDERYGYHRYGGNVHVIPNHALIHLGLNYAAGSLTRGLAIVTTSGWDTDCNAGNLGALLGLQLGLNGFDTATAVDAAAAPTTDARDWRGPIADRIWLPTAEGSRAITDAVLESLEIVAVARGVHGVEPFAPKDGARFSFVFPGSVQGFEASVGRPGLEVHNVESAVFDGRVLAIEVPGGTGPATGSRTGTDADAAESPIRVSTDTFVRPSARERFGTYELLASPTLHPGQDVTATIARIGGEGSLTAAIVIGVYGADDELHHVAGPEVELAIIPSTLRLRVPDTGGQPIASVGVQLGGGGSGRVELDRLAWSGTPEVTWVRPDEGGRMWRHAWIDGVTHFDTTWPDDAIRVIQDAGTGLLMTGGPWSDLTVESELTPQLAAEVGLAVRVAGLRRYHALVLTHEGGGSTGEARLVRREHAEETVLARIPLEWETGRAYALTLTESGGVLRGTVNGAGIGPVPLATGAPLGGIGILVTEGRVGTSRVHVSPARVHESAADLSGVEGSTS